MADTKVTTNGNVQVWVVPVASIANYLAPTVAEITSGLEITDAIAWTGTTFPAASGSDDIEDRSMRDKGNATSRGAAKFEGTLALFYPKVLTDNTSVYGKVYQMFRTPRVPVYIITRVLQGTTGVSTLPVAGDWISVYRHLSDGWTNNIDGDDSYKYVINFMPQGEIAVYTQVKNSTPPTVTPAGPVAVTVASGTATPLRAVLGGKRATQSVNWVSSNLAVATVSQNGVVVPVAAGTASITATHPSASAASTAVVFNVT